MQMEVNSKKANKQNRCLIDAITITYIGMTVDDLVYDVLHLGWLQWQRIEYGRYGYKARTSFGAIHLLSDGSPQMGICLELRGQGCRELEQLCNCSDIYYRLLTTAFAKKINLSRIDIAIDDFEQLLDMEIIERKVDIGEVVTRLRKRTVIKWLSSTTGHTVGLGSRDRYYLRIYDKAAEQAANYPWIRVELEIRHDAAAEFHRLVIEQVEKISTEKDAAIVKAGVGVIADKIRFVEKSESNLSRCRTSPWWAKLFEGIDPINLTINRKLPLNIEQAMEWQKKQIAPSLALLTAYLCPAVIDALMHDGLHKIDIQRAIEWSQQLYAAGFTLACGEKLDGTNDMQKIENIIDKQLGDYFGSIATVST